MKKIHSEEEKEIFRYGMSHAGIFGIVYQAMEKSNKDPFGKDIDEYFSMVESMRDSVCKNPIAKQLYKDAMNLREEK